MKPLETKSSKLGMKTSRLGDTVGDAEERRAVSGSGRSSRGRSAADDDELDVEFDEDFELPEGEVLAEARPNPVELPSPINPEGRRKQSVESHRNLYCLHYDGCLDEAVKHGWNSFTCVRCSLYSAEKPEESGVGRVVQQRRYS
jgi:hypothetical protein